MKQLTTLCFFLLTALILHAQPVIRPTLTGQLLDSSKGTAVPFATLILKTDAASSSSQKLLSDADGRFKWSSLSARPVMLYITSTGFRDLRLDLQDHSLSDSIIDLGKIFMLPISKDLQEVIVKSTRPLIKQEIDRLSYDVQADPESKAQNLMELLRKVPLISVDADDNIQLQGSSSFRIFINGRPSSMMASNMKEALRAIPAGVVQKIEVITTPPAKYDSEGLAGIINIIMTRKTDNGINATLNARNSFPFGPSLNLTTTAKQGKWGITASGGGANNNEVTIASSNRRETFLPGSVFEQDFQASAKGRNWFGNSEVSFEADSLNLFTFSGYLSKGKSYQTDDRNTQFNSTDPGVKEQQYRLKNEASSPWNFSDLSVNYQRNFKNDPQRILTFSFRQSRSDLDRYVQSNAFDAHNYFLPDNRQWNATSLRENTFQIDYVQPFKKLTIEAGVKAILRKNTSLASVANLVFDGTDSSYTEDPDRRNDFHYRQDVLSVYNSYNWKQGLFTVKAGLRFEYTLVDAAFKTTATALNTTFGNFTPSLSVMRTLSDNQSLTFGFSSRIERPGIGLLNPFVDRSNPQLISKGNPALKPVQSYQGEISYTRTGKGSLNLRTSYLYSSGTITSVVRILSDTLSETTYDNIGKNAILRLGVNGNYPIGKFSLNFNTGGFYVWVSGPYNGRFYSNKGIRTNTFANLSYRPGKEWTFGASVGYNRRYITLQGSSNDYAYYSVSSSKGLFNKKLSLTMVLSNFARKHYAFTQYSSTPEFYQSTTRNGIYRNATISLSYKFGKQPGSIKKNKRGISNDDSSSAQ